MKTLKNYKIVTFFLQYKKKWLNFKKKNPNKKIIKLGIGDVTRPIPKVCIEAMKKSCR